MIPYKFKNANTTKRLQFTGRWPMMCVLLATALLQVSCDKDQLKDSDSIRFSISGGKAGYTRGIPVYTENLASVYGSFSVSAYHGGIISNPYWEGLTATPNGTIWDLGTQAENYFWPESQGKLRFFAWAPTTFTAEKTFADNGTITFSHTVPHSTDGTADAEAQQDLLVTSTPLYSSKDNPADLIFFHTLAAIQFKAGVLAPGITINTITLQGVKNTGTCTVTPDYSKKSYECASWSNGTTTDNYTQTFDMGSLSLDDPINDSNQSMTFMMMPQSVENVNVVVGLTYEENVLTKTFPLPEGITWQAGKIYPYRLNLTFDGRILLLTIIPEDWVLSEEAFGF